MPRVALPDELKRSVVQSIRFSPVEWAVIETWAEKAGRAPRVFVRECALSRKLGTPGVMTLSSDPPRSNSKHKPSA